MEIRTTKEGKLQLTIESYTKLELIADKLIISGIKSEIATQLEVDPINFGPQKLGPKPIDLTENYQTFNSTMLVDGHEIVEVTNSDLNLKHNDVIKLTDGRLAKIQRINKYWWNLIDPQTNKQLNHAFPLASPYEHLTLTDLAKNNFEFDCFIGGDDLE